METTDEAPPVGAVELPVRAADVGLRWWREVVYVIAFYAVYTLVRSRISAAAGPAFANADRIIAAERAVGLYVEQPIQRTFLRWEAFVAGWNIFYGTLHFLVTPGVLIFLFRRRAARYRRWRTVLAVTTGLALVGFAFFPLAPPRLLPGYVDTLREIDSLWSFDDGPMQKISNPYAAMPSLHFGWSLWCALALWPVVRRWWSKALTAAYPAATLFAIVVTANHFWLDAVGGALVVGLGWAAARRLFPAAAQEVRTQ